ncbi:TolC family outer membrane protein [Rhodoblastus sp.]|uniref:TolC family outer membrane protein n=1 Tax=Rhodoblastus sp. TaxID=1962975 RepID=UPI0025D3A339|nr:TolC family outer membrane protein [Rhodoblastus sp.]
MRRSSIVGLTLATYALCLGPAAAESMSGALSRAYSNNPDVNQARAGVRAQDETVPGAKAGWLPKVNAQGSIGHQFTRNTNPPGAAAREQKYLTDPTTGSVTLTQTLFDGMRTANSVDQAESGVLAARENLRGSEISTLGDAATFYMDVLRDTAVLGLRRNNVKVLQVQLQQTRDRFHVGEVTRTDVAQAESSLANGTADVAVAEARLQASMANYRRVIGVEPRQLQPAQPIEKLLPPSLDLAVATGLSENPAVIGALHQVDVAEDQVKINEGALLPQIGVQAQVQNQTDAQGVPGYGIYTASVVGVLNVPIYQGGSEYAQVRQSKEKLSQARLAVETQRYKVRSDVVTAWGNLQSSRAAITSFQAAVKAAEIALTGVREEAKVGQRTTLDVLNAEQTLLNTRVQLVQAQHDRVVASYSVMAAIGRLTARNLGLGVVAYDPNHHYDQTKNRFFGLNTPDGR